jgi:hypothetical protein
MPLTITVPDEIVRAAEAVARTMGASAEDLLIQALQAHFGPISPELQAELEAWERASDEDLARLEQQDDLGWR